MSRTDEMSYIRPPAEIKGWLKKKAQESRRSFTAEVVYRLEQSRKSEEAQHANAS